MINDLNKPMYDVVNVLMPNSKTITFDHKAIKCTIEGVVISPEKFEKVLQIIAFSRVSNVSWPGYYGEEYQQYGMTKTNTAGHFVFFTPFLQKVEVSFLGR